MEEVDKD